MRVLHISADYPYTPLYRQLLMQFAADSSATYSHTMYVPLPFGRETTNYDYSASNVRVLFSSDFRGVDRYLYHVKRKRIVDRIEAQVPMKDVDAVHAHFLFSAGGVAYQLKQRFGVPYVVAVRNADLNFFLRYALHLRGFGLRVLSEASKIIFISPAYRKTLIERYVPSKLRDAIEAKSLVIPNGIDSFWFENRQYRDCVTLQREIRLVFAGQLTRNKNLETTIKVVDVLRARGYAASLTIIGEGPHQGPVKNLAATRSSYVTLHPWERSQSALLAKYRESDIFIMPSFTETFGLVYIEAMSQGLPVVYSQGQGIDGFFPNGRVGYACDPRDALGIAEKIESLITDYPIVSRACTDAIESFAWTKIARQYEALYDSL